MEFAKSPHPASSRPPPNIILAGLLLRLHPADCLLTALLALSVLVAGICLPTNPLQLQGLLIQQSALLLCFVAVLAICTHWERRRFVAYLRPAAIVTIVFTLYTSLGKLGMAAMPYTVDAELSNIDTWLCRVDPSLFIEQFLTPGRIEFFSFAYGAFIPYIYVTIVLNCLGRPPLERDQFLTGWVLTYCISYLGYIFLPAAGPLLYHAADYSVALNGGVFYDMVLSGVEATGGLEGAFPSLHVGGSLYLCLFELRVNRLRGLIYLPLVALIYVATLVLRYHYVVDLLAGTLIAASCLPCGRALFGAWARRRQAAGLAALPGGEGDALPAAAPAGAGDAQALFSPD